MIKMFPTNPGFSQEWTVEIDFSANGMEKVSQVCATWRGAVDFVRIWLSEGVQF